MTSFEKPPSSEKPRGKAGKMVRAGLAAVGILAATPEAGQAEEYATQSVADSYGGKAELERAFEHRFTIVPDSTQGNGILRRKRNTDVTQSMANFWGGKNNLEKLLGHSIKVVSDSKPDRNQ